MKGRAWYIFPFIFLSNLHGEAEKRLRLESYGWRSVGFPFYFMTGGGVRVDI
jgi:hypothetical protein